MSFRVTIVACGRKRPGPEQNLFDHYAGRLAWPVDLIYVEEKKPLKGDALKEREADLLMKAAPEGSRLIALDERGRALSSPDLAGWIGRARDDGAGRVTFLIGGAAGLHQSVRQKADLVLCLGAVTWPHQLVPALLAEQLFRCHAILTGHPYHRE